MDGKEMIEKMGLANGYCPGFKELPAGVTFKQISDAIVDVKREEWLGWLAVDCPDGTWAERLTAVAATSNQGYWLGELAVHSPIGTLTERLEAADRSFEPAYYRAQALDRYSIAKGKKDLDF